MCVAASILIDNLKRFDPQMVHFATQRASVDRGREKGITGSTDGFARSSGALSSM